VHGAPQPRHWGGAVHPPAKPPMASTTELGKLFQTFTMRAEKMLSDHKNVTVHCGP